MRRRFRPAAQNEKAGKRPLLQYHTSVCFSPVRLNTRRPASGHGAAVCR